MKSLKSLFALFAIVTLSVGCAAVNEAPATAKADAHEVVITVADEATFTGTDVKPIITKPKI